MEPKMCRIPIQAKYEIIDGEAVMVSAEWADIPAVDIALYLIQKLGPNFWEKEREAIT